ncbi:MAG: molybdenum cofactor guanylyltransferase [Verrucomicrobiota bacterium]
MSFAGLVLVGGRSRRMGLDKAALPAPDGAPGTLLDHQIATLRHAGAEPVLLAGRADQTNPRPDLCWLTDAPEAVGPLAGLLTGLKACPHPWLAVLAVDMPRFPAAEFARWHRTADPKSGWIIAGPHGYEPLAALYPRGALAPMQELAARGVFRLQDQIKNLIQSGVLQVCQKSTLQTARLANWNTPDDLRQS